MKTVKIYNIETEKRKYLAIGTSIKDVKDYVDENKRDLSLDIGRHFKVTLNKDTYVNWYDMCDENIDSINLTDDKDANLTPDVTTSDAEYNLLLDKDLQL